MENTKYLLTIEDIPIQGLLDYTQIQFGTAKSDIVTVSYTEIDKYIEVVNKPLQPSHFRPRKNVDNFQRKKKQFPSDERDMKEYIVVWEKKSFSYFIIRYYDETLYVNEIIYYGDCLTDLVFNNYVKYLNNVYNGENKFLIFESDTQKKIELEYEMIENDF